MDRDWDAVARAIDERLIALDMTQAELAVRARVAPETIRELRNNLRPRRRNPRTLAAISEALGWEPGQLTRILTGGTGTAAPAGEPGLAEIRRELAELAGRVEAIERSLDGQ